MKHDQEIPFTYKCESSLSRKGCSPCSTENTYTTYTSGDIYLKSGNNWVSLMTFKDLQGREPQLLPSLFHWTDCADLACNYRAISFPQECSAARKHPSSLQQFPLLPNYLQYLPTGSLNTFLWTYIEVLISFPKIPVYLCMWHMHCNAGNKKIKQKIGGGDKGRK